MMVRIPLALILIVGCNGSMNNDSGDTVAPQTGSETGTGSESGSPGSETQGSTEPGGGQSATGPTEGQDTGSSSTSDTGDTSTTGDGSTSGSTGTCAGSGPAPVILGAEDDLAAPGAYVVLAEAAITNVPGSKISGGNVGVSPAAAGSITGFGLVLDDSGVYSTSPEVVAPGKVYAADYMAPTPVNLTTAVLGMQAAYIDAAGRIPTDYLDLESGDLGGLTLAPGIYTWGSTVLVPEDVTLDGCEDDVWIFQVAGDLDVSTGKSVLLAGGARARNVFWQIAGQATVHVGAHLEGVVLSKTGITLQTEASLNGRAYAQTMVALDKNAVTAP